MQAAGIERGLASISHDGEYAVAHVALELGSANVAAAATAGVGAHAKFAALELYQAPSPIPVEATSTL